MSRPFRDVRDYVKIMLTLYLMLGVSWLLMEFLLPYYWVLKGESLSVQDLIETTDRLISEVAESIYLIVVCVVAYAMLLQFVRVAYALIIKPLVLSGYSSGISTLFVLGVMHSSLNLYIVWRLAKGSYAIHEIADYLLTLL